MADRPCPAGCGGQLITRDDRTIQCEKCGADPWLSDRFVRNPPVYPVRKGSNLTKADLLGPENYDSLRSAGDYGRRPLYDDK